MLRFVRSARTLSFASAVVFGSVLTSAASAQVGHLPGKSPYEDMKVGQDLTVFLGQFNSNVGPAGVLPKAALFGGVRYDLPLGGPGFLTARYTLIPTERNLILASNPRRTRLLSVESQKVNVVDVGFSIGLTGRKTWHRLAPTISIGTGLAFDGQKADTGGYKFGTKFSFTGGGAVRYQLRNNWAIRADATNYLWRNSYPDAYYAAASDTTRVLTPATSQKSWRGTWGFSLGLIVPIFR